MSNQEVELVIVGSGPAGYTAAVYAARAGLAPVVIAGSVTAGGALMTTTEVENFPGFVDGVQGPELMESMRAQAERFGAEIVYDDATRLDLSGDMKTIETGAGATYRARAVILTMGSAYRKLGLPEEERLSVHGVSWCATCDGFFFREQEIVVVGGGDSAMEEALFLTRVPAGDHRRGHRLRGRAGRPALPVEPRTRHRCRTCSGGLRMSAVTPVTDATFQAEVVDSELPAVVDIWATWCGPCRAIAPILDQLAGEYAGRVKIVKVDADQNPETVTAAGVTSIPTLGFYRNGERMDVLIGAHPKPVYAAKIEELLA